MSKMLDLAGQRFGQLTVICRGPSTPAGRTRWHCICACGGTSLSSTANLRTGGAASCGCRTRTMSAAALTKHGYAKAGTKRPSEYTIWKGMKQRCLNPNNPHYEDYGGRGITVCDRWTDAATGFISFLADMGPRPSPAHSIERKNNADGYSPDNCKWAVKKEQANNKRNNVDLVAFGVKKKQHEWAKEMGIPDAMIHYWLKRNPGVPFERYVEWRNQKTLRKAA